MGKVRTLRQKCEAINDSYLGGMKTLYGTAELCAQLKLDKKNKKEAMSYLHMSDTYFSMYSSIGNSPHLKNPTVRALLRPEVTIVYEVGKLTEAQFDEALADGILNLKMKREDITAWVKSKKSKPTDKSKKPRRQTGSIEVDEDYDISKEQALRETISNMVKGFSAHFIVTKTAQQMAEERASRAFHNTVRKEARKELAKHKKLLTQGLKKAEKVGRWPYAKEDVAITGNTTDEEIEEIFKRVGLGYMLPEVMDRGMAALDDIMSKVKPPADDPEADQVSSEMLVPVLAAKRFGKSKKAKTANWT